MYEQGEATCLWARDIFFLGGYVLLVGATCQRLGVYIHDQVNRSSVIPQLHPRGRFFHRHLRPRHLIFTRLVVERSAAEACRRLSADTSLDSPLTNTTSASWYRSARAVVLPEGGVTETTFDDALR